MSVLLKNSFNDLVFEKRNQSFGAYLLRNLYSVYLFKGFVISSTLFTLFILTPLISTMFKKKEKEKIAEIVEVTLADIPPLNPNTPPPPPVSVKIEAPQISKVKFIPPKVVPDKEIKTEEILPTNDELKESNPGDRSQEGVKEGIESAPVPSQPVIEEKRKEEVYTYVPKMPAPINGLNEFLKFISENVEYSSQARKKHIQGKVVVEFYVDIDGSLKDLKVIAGLGHGLDEEALRVIGLSPKWSPGLKDGRPVKVKQRIPISFELE